MKKHTYNLVKIMIKDTKNGGFKIVQGENDDYQLATLLEFKPTDSDLPIEEVRDFAEDLVELYNNYI